MIVERIPPQDIKNSDTVRFTRTGHIAEIMKMEHISRGNPLVKKISKDEYLCTVTGEIKEYNHTENRGQQKNELRKTFKKIRNIINCNVTNPKKCKFVTLTYRQRDSPEEECKPMRDTVKLMKDFEKFRKAIKYRYGDFEYISVAEPQRTGSWHLHVIMIFSHNAPTIPYEEFSKCWKHGFFDIQMVTKADNLGAYLSAYLGNIPLKEALEEGIYYTNKDIQISKDNKLFIKGGRLHYYPTGFNIFRASRGIKRPQTITTTYEEAKKRVGNLEPTMKNSIFIYEEKPQVNSDTLEENLYTNTITYEYYNSKRK